LSDFGFRISDFLPPALSFLAASLLLLPAAAQKPNEPPPPEPSEKVSGKDGLRWLSLTNGTFEINGLPWFKENDGELSRLPLRSKSLFRKEVWSLAQCPSGARIRFRTDSTRLAIRLEYSSPPNMANMH